MYEKTSVDMDKVKKVEKWVDNYLRIHKFIEEKDLGEVSYKNMYCVFHSETNPSLFVDSKGEFNRFKCHSCGRSGGFIKFYQSYLEIFEGKKLNYYETIEAIVRQNFRIQTELDVLTIYKKSIEDTKLSEIKVNAKHKPKRLDKVIASKTSPKEWIEWIDKEMKKNSHRLEVFKVTQDDTYKDLTLSDLADEE